MAALKVAHQLGRLPRGHDPRIPHRRTLARAAPEALPDTVDYSVGMAADLGAMLNLKLSDCTAAACGHARQVWTFNANPPMVTPADSAVLALYETQGYVTGSPATDLGAVEQSVLTQWLKAGFDSQQLTAFYEVDAKYLDGIEITIQECGGIYIGFEVPSYLMDLDEAPESVWDVNASADDRLIGGHAVYVAGYDNVKGLRVCSWGNWYWMSWSFWLKYVDEAYGLVDSDWIRSTGMTPCGLTLAEWRSAMQALAMP